jgi:NADH-quinone oxidoreductase subunit C
MRKDFPLWGRVEIRYDETLKRIVYEPVDLSDDYRKFDNQSAWRDYPVSKPVSKKEGA